MGPRAVAILILFIVALFASCKDDKPTPDAGPLADAPMCSGTTPFLTDCTADDQCMTCVCRSFGHSQYCSQACIKDTDCPAPSGGCTSGFCRR